MHHNEMIQVLREVLAKRRPELVSLADEVGVEVLSEEQLDALGDIVFQEFLEEGLQEDDEPNPYGTRLDDLLGWLVQEHCNP